MKYNEDNDGESEDDRGRKKGGENSFPKNRSTTTLR